MASDSEVSDSTCRSDAMQPYANVRCCHITFSRSCTTLAERMIQGLAALVWQSSTGALPPAVEPCEQFMFAMHKINARTMSAVRICFTLHGLRGKVLGINWNLPGCMFIGLVSLQAKGSQCAEPGHV